MSEQRKRNLQKLAEKYTQTLNPIAHEVAVGSVFGFCAGFFSRQAAKSALFITGGAFIFLQYLSHKGYISINAKKIEQDLEKAADLDGDGKLTTNDISFGFKKLLVILGEKVPNTAGFAAAYFLGLSGKLL